MARRRRWGNRGRGRSYPLTLAPRFRNPMGWHRVPSTVLPLSAATQRAEFVIASGAGLSPTPAVELAMNRTRSAFLERLILRLAVVVTNQLTAQLLKYWFGFRLQEATDAGGNIAIADAPALNVADAGDRREGWLYRKSLVTVTPGAGAAITSFVDSGGSPAIQLDFKPRRPLEIRQLLVFQHYWEVAGGGAPDAVLTAHLETDTLVRLPP